MTKETQYLVVKVEDLEMMIKALRLSVYLTG
jgi:hypothetical protein